MRIESAAVVGAGVMGAGIAQVLAIAGYSVALCDVSDAALESARERIENGRFGLRKAAELGKLTEDQASEALSRITTTTDQPPHEVDLVIEAVYEDIGLKSSLLRSLDEHLQPDAIIASNSSGFSAETLAAATDRPDRVLVWHFASPVPVMPLAEIVVTRRTDPDVIAAIVEVAHATGKNPVVVNDQPMTWGFVTNRVFSALTQEADRIVAEGIATPEQVDQLLKDCFRWPAGPFEMLRSTRSAWEADAPTEKSDKPVSDHERRVMAYCFPSTSSRDPAEPERTGTAG